MYTIYISSLILLFSNLSEYSDIFKSSEHLRKLLGKSKIVLFKEFLST